MIIQGRKSRDKYYYDEEKLTITDKEGNCIKLYESLEGIPLQNLQFYLDSLFAKFYKLSNEFKMECIADKRDGIIWEDFK